MKPALAHAIRRARALGAIRQMADVRLEVKRHVAGHLDDHHHDDHGYHGPALPERVRILRFTQPLPVVCSQSIRKGQRPLWTSSTSAR